MQLLLLKCFRKPFCWRLRIIRKCFEPRTRSKLADPNAREIETWRVRFILKNNSYSMFAKFKHNVQKVVHISDWKPFFLFLQAAPKSKQNRSNFGHLLKSDLFDNWTKVVCPKSELVRILALYCIYKRIEKQCENQPSFQRWSERLIYVH